MRDFRACDVLKDRKRRTLAEKMKKKDAFMKINRILFAGAIAAILSFAGQARAQYKINEDDGIAASPKVRQMLNERKASQAAAALSKSGAATGFYAGYRPAGSDGIAASPRTRQMLDEQRASRVVASQESTAVAGYRPVGNDGITASPRVRQQLNERGGVLMIAPVK